jgi:AcrR family transcriptional regulator
VRAAVLEATLAELAEFGYRELSLESVARRAGVHKTTLYRRWGTREALLLDVFREIARQRAPIPDTGSLHGDLLRYARQITASVTTPEVSALAAAIASEGPNNPAFADMLRTFWAERFEVGAVMISRAIERGEVSAESDPKLTLEAVLGPIYFRLLVSGEKLDPRFIKRLVELVASALEP